MNLITAVNDFLIHHKLTERRLVLGLSGGIDSVVLLDLLVKSNHPKNQIIAVHVNHGLSEGAENWQHFCEVLCRDYGIDSHSEYVSVDSQKLGLEGGAREVRYHALAKYIDVNSTLITAQHQDDQAETLLLALKRGSGVLGLGGMMPVSQFHLGQQARPLLDISQQQINDYADELGLEWVEDESNQDTRFDRNFLRSNTLEQLNKRWPNVSASIARSATLCQEQMQLADEVAEMDLGKSVTPLNQFALSLLNGLSDVRVNNLLRYWLRLNQVVLPSRKQFKQLKQQCFAVNDANVLIELGDKQLRRFQQRLYVVETSPLEPLASIAVSQLHSKVLLPENLGVIELASRQPWQRIKAPNGELITIEFGLAGSVKAWPSQRNKRRSLKKLWQEFDVPPWQRSLVPCLCYDGKIIAALGYWVETGYIAKDTDNKALAVEWQHT